MNMVPKVVAKTLNWYLLYYYVEGFWQFVIPGSLTSGTAVLGFGMLPGGKRSFLNAKMRQKIPLDQSAYTLITH